MLKRLNNSNREILKQKVNDVLNQFNKTIDVLIKKFFDVKNLISLHESSEILSVSSILRK